MDTEVISSDPENVIIAVNYAPMSKAQDTFYKALYSALEDTGTFAQFCKALAIDTLIPVLCKPGCYYTLVSMEAFDRVVRLATWLLYDRHLTADDTRVLNVYYEAHPDREVAALREYMSRQGFEIVLTPVSEPPATIPKNGVVLSISEPLSYGWFDAKCCHHTVDPDKHMEPAALDNATHVTAVFAAPDLFNMAAHLLLMFKSENDKTLREAVGTCTQLCHKVKQARLRLQELNGECAKSNAHVFELKSQVSDLRAELETLESEKKDVLHSKKQATNVVAARKKDLSGIRQQADTLQIQVSKMNEQLQLHQADICALQEKIKQAHVDADEYNLLLESVTAKRAKHTELLEEQAGLDGAIAALESKSEALERRAEAEEARARAAQKRLDDAQTKTANCTASARHVIESASRSLHNMADLLMRNLSTALSIHDPQNPGS